MVAVNKETIIKKEIRRLIRQAIKWNKIDDGFPEFWSNNNYKYSKKLSQKEIRKKNYPYYIKSERAIKDIAEKIYKLKLEAQKGK